MNDIVVQEVIHSMRLKTGKKRWFVARLDLVSL